jgi:hypothetical protein
MPILQESARAMSQELPEVPQPDLPQPDKLLTPAAQRALAEARARREAQDAKAAELAKHREIAGRGGLEPVRYDDWEVKGIASDF